MASTQRRVDRGRQRGDRLLIELGIELRDARMAAGLSQATVARAAEMSHSQLSRLERGLVVGASIQTFARSFAVLGLRFVARGYPDGEPLRDAGQARLLLRFRGILPSEAKLRTEVLLGIPGDLRAWDAQLASGGDEIHIEAETALRDLQATDRRIAMKMRDGGVDRVLLLVSDTARNRRVLAGFRELIRERYPLDGRAVKQALRAGRCPERSGILLL